MSDLRQFFDNISANVKQMNEKPEPIYNIQNIQRKYGKKKLTYLIYNKLLSIQPFLIKHVCLNTIVH